MHKVIIPSGLIKYKYWYCILYIVFLSLKIFFVLANSVDTDEMPHYAAFIWVYTVCQITYLGVYKRLNMQEQSPNFYMIATLYLLPYHEH